MVGPFWIAEGIVIGAFVALSIFLANWLMRPVTQIIEGVKRISEGDPTTRISVAPGGELNVLADAFNSLGERIQRTLSVLKQDASTLAGSADELLNTPTSLSGTSSQSSQQSTTVADAAEEMSVNMANMATSINQVSETVSNTATARGQMEETIVEIARSAERCSSVASDAATMAERRSHEIDELGDSASQIGQVIQVIQYIADQTNLLALNATIEAARAGDAGKGFAVVATEVKAFARQTAAATEDIREKIEAIQSTTGAAIHSIEAINKGIGAVNEENLPRRGGTNCSRRSSKWSAASTLRIRIPVFVSYAAKSSYAEANPHF